MREGWTETTLGEVAVFYNGKAYKQDELLAEGKYRVLRVGNFFSNGNWYWSDLELDANKYCDHGDLLYAWSASFGPRIWTDEKVIYHYHIWKVEENPIYVEKMFLFYWLQDDVQRMKRDAGTGSIMMHITKGEIEIRAIALPPLVEQKRIVDLVSSVDAYVDALQQQADTARTARNAVLYELLSASGDDWTETTLNLISHNISSRRIPITKSDRNPGLFPYYGASGIVDYVDEYIFDERTLLISEDGANLLARSTPIAFGAIGKYWVNNHAHVLKFDEISTQNYVEYYLNSIRIDEWVTGAAQPKLNQKSLNEIPVHLPPLVEQKRIVGIVSSMDEVIQATEQSVSDAKNLRSGLLSDLLSGEHEIPESYDEFVGAA